MRIALSRDFYIPPNAVKVADKASDAVAYIHDRNGVPYAVAFAGKAIRPTWNFRFRTVADRERRIAEHFTNRRAGLAAKAERKASRKRMAVAIGDVFVSSWGYEQTNVDFYQVTALVGATMVELRKIGAVDVDTTGPMQGTCKALPGHFIGEPMRRRIGEYGIRIDDCRHASPWDGRPRHWSSYH